MEIKTYTHIWSTPKMFYTVGDITLPRPIPFITLGMFFLIGAIWIPLMLYVNLPLGGNPMGWIILLGVPGALSYYASKPIFEDKNLFLFILSYLGFALEPKRMGDMSEDAESGEYTISATYWEKGKPR